MLRYLCSMGGILLLVSGVYSLEAVEKFDSDQSLRRSSLQSSGGDRIIWHDRLDAASQGWRSINRSQNFQLEFTADGTRISGLNESGSSGSDWSLQMRLERWGSKGALAPLSCANWNGLEVAPLVSGDRRIEFDRGPVIEWYVDREAGMEQGFTVLSRPANASRQSLALEIVMRTKLTPGLSSNGRAIEFRDPSEKIALRYGGLHVFDAAGKSLESAINFLPANEANAWRVSIEIADQNAEFPVIVDPVFSGEADTTLIGGQADGFLGASVAGVGDVNGDGYDDVIVGASSYTNGNTDEGIALIYHGGPAGVVDGGVAQANTFLEPNQNDAGFGSNVAGAGDVNGDGYADVIIGAHKFDGLAGVDMGSAFIFHGSPSGIPSGNITAAATALRGSQAGGFFGFDVASAGDVNGDGYGDVIVGASMHNGALADEGAAFIFHGGPSGIAWQDASTANTTLLGGVALAAMGYRVSGAGDVNSDGYDDVIVYSYTYNGVNGGEVFIFHGGPSGIPNGNGDSAQTSLNSSGVLTNFGSAIAGAGDVNGDGYGDILVGADNFGLRGAAYIFAGGPVGVTDSTELTAMTRLEASVGDPELGSDVAGAGDVNGDGYADVVIGARRYADNFSEEGGAFLYLGGDGGIPSGDFIANADAIVTSNRLTALMGWSVDGAGDVNGDGFDDLIIGAPNADDNLNNEGAALVYHGQPLGMSKGGPASAQRRLEFNTMNAGVGFSSAGVDVNGDGYTDVVEGAPFYQNGQVGEGAMLIYMSGPSGVAGSPFTLIESDVTGLQFGYSIANAGDINGDGFEDVLVGAPYFADGETNEGAAFVFYGSASGIDSGNLSLAATSLQANQAFANFGWSVANAGDINGDGYSDAIIGAPEYAQGQTGEGVAFIFIGGPAGIASGGIGGASAVIEGNQANARLAYSVAGAGDVNRDGYSDVIIGSKFYTNVQDQEGAAFIFHGSASGIASGNPATAAATIEGNQAGAFMGSSVAGAGDLNGDGFADVIIGAPYYLNPDSGLVEGGAFMFVGSASGVADGEPLTAAGTIYSFQENSLLGASVAGAGDLNGDGFGDVIVGAPNYTAGQNQEGGAFVFFARFGLPPSAFPATADGRVEGDQAFSNLGYHVAGGGDINGDGFSDVIVGSYNFDNGQTDEGSGFVLYGALGTGLGPKPRQRRASDAVGIVPGLRSDSAWSFRLGAIGRSLYGRGDVKLQWEVKPLGTPFNGGGLQESADWIDSGTAGATLSELITVMPTSIYHWRLRLLHRMRNAPFATHSRWVNQASDGWQLADVRTGPYNGRPVGDFDNSGCTEILDFLFLLDYWQTLSPIGAPPIDLTDFLSVLDNWQLGPACS